jgi:hypothetical protein
MLDNPFSDDSSSTSTSLRKPKIHYNLHKIPHNESVCIISTIPLRPVLILIHNRDLLQGGLRSQNMRLPTQG